MTELKKKNKSHQIEIKILRIVCDSIHIWTVKYMRVYICLNLQAICESGGFLEPIHALYKHQSEQGKQILNLKLPICVL